MKHIVDLQWDGDGGVIAIEKKTGDYTKAGEVIATLYTDDESSLNDAQRRYLNAVQISSEKPKELPMILGKIE